MFLISFFLGGSDSPVPLKAYHSSTLCKLVVAFITKSLILFLFFFFFIRLNDQVSCSRHVEIIWTSGCLSHWKTDEKAPTSRKVFSKPRLPRRGPDWCNVPPHDMYLKSFGVRLHCLMCNACCIEKALASFFIAKVCQVYCQIAIGHSC